MSSCCGGSPDRQHASAELNSETQQNPPSDPGSAAAGVSVLAGSGCCGGSGQNHADRADDVSRDTMRDQVRSGYADIARSGTLLLDEGKEEFGGGCCGPAKAPLTHAFLAGELGYTEDELKALPEGANMGLSCGNPTAIANLKPGQVVLDLGSGGGFDCFLAGPKVGPEGRVIGVDMTPEMLSKARTNIASYRETTGLDNVEFRLGEIEHLPVADASVDVIISNCVINLSPDKPQVWREVTRVLRPGGRIVASDIALIRPLPENVQAMVEALIGCVSGAVLIDTYREMVTTAGLREVELRPKPEYVAALESFQDPLYRRIAENLPAGTKPADYITSIDVTAVR